MFATGARSFVDHDLLSYASTIAFQVLLALIPLALTAVALLGFLDLEEVWESELAPVVRDRVQEDAFSVIDRTVEQILGGKRGLWLTVGLAFAIWQVSGAVRAAMTPLNLIYGVNERRRWWHRLLVSFALALAIGPLVVGATLLIQAGEPLVARLDAPGVVAFVLHAARWGIALALLVVAIWLLIRFAPADPQSLAWTGIGTVFVVASWTLTSLGFALYATFIADYASIFAGLATLYVLLTYLYLSSLALLFGVQLDACVRAELRD